MTVRARLCAFSFVFASVRESEAILMRMRKQVASVGGLCDITEEHTN
jgi:hypothetical protein